MSNDNARSAALAEIITAYELFGIANGDYLTSGGFNDDGRGYFYNNTLASYPNGSTADALIADGYLSAPAPIDPLLANVGSVSLYDPVVVRCGNRVGVFSYTDALETRQEDAQWWSANNCAQNARTLERPYLVVSDPVDAIDLSSENNGTT